MSLGEAVEPVGDRTTALRALAHPLRLRMLSLLTGAAMTAAELARELGITHANASYHLRQLHAADLITIAGEEHIRGGVAKRYRYHLEREWRQPERAHSETSETSETVDARELVYAAVTVELQRRAALRQPGRSHLTDAELWVAPDEWDAIRDQVHALSDRLHRAARPPRTPGTIRVNATIVLFPMESGDAGR